MENLHQFLSECEGAPRLNQLAGFFSETASGTTGTPVRKPTVDRRLLPQDPLLHRLIDLHAQRQGFFDQHYHSSIPYRLEEECRMALALMRYAEMSPSPLLLYTLGTADGPDAFGDQRRED